MVGEEELLNGSKRLYTVRAMENYVKGYYIIAEVCIFKIII